MKNKEIEELLNKAKDIAKYDVDGKQHTRMFNQFEAKALLSYIEQLEKENDRLKKDYAIVINDNCDYITLGKKIEQLENNRDKAIEYIDNNTHYYSTDTGEEEFVIDTENEEEFCNTLKNILKGDSDE